MNAMTLVCANPSCQRQVSFDRATIGTVQQCPHCGQKMLVPDLVVSDAQAAIVPVPVMPQPSAHQTHNLQNQAQYYPNNQTVVTGSQHPYNHPAQQMGPQAPYMQQQERHLESQTARRLNMGSGCFAMLAVMFAFGVLSAGITFIFGQSQVITGIALVVGSLAGIAAFMFFGYFAAETTSSSRGSDRR